MAGYSFQIFRDRKKSYRVRFVARNGETMFSTAGYASKASAMNAIRSIVTNSPDAAVEVVAPAAKTSKKRAANAVRKGAMDFVDDTGAEVRTVDDALDFANARLAAMNGTLESVLETGRAQRAALLARESKIDRTLAQTGTKLSRLVGEL